MMRMLIIFLSIKVINLLFSMYAEISKIRFFALLHLITQCEIVKCEISECKAMLFTF